MVAVMMVVVEVMVTVVGDGSSRVGDGSGGTGSKRARWQEGRKDGRTEGRKDGRTEVKLARTADRKSRDGDNTDRNSDLSR